MEILFVRLGVVLVHSLSGSRDSSVGPVNRLWTGRFSVQIPAGVGDFSHFQNVQTASGAHPPSYSVGTGGPFPAVKRPGHELDQILPSSANAKNE
jgi:hypothetical protein